MAIVYDTATLDRYMASAVDASPEHPILIDQFLEDAFELDVDALADAQGTWSSAASWSTSRRPASTPATAPASCRRISSPSGISQTIRDYTRRIARALKVIGLMNAQFAIKDDIVYVLEVNPRASRTVPYLSKATGVPLAKVAARLMVGGRSRRARADAGSRGDRACSSRRRCSRSCASRASTRFSGRR